ncbi:hypothetical protein ACFUIY_13265 [Streptomyces griseorubiginosus]|uniref:hypothetical protein n=1 Tax=Streptomyces griseorubiginosus TaxID=67304 RepID=UPI00363A90EF
MTVPTLTQLRTENQALSQALDRANTTIRYMKVALAVLTGTIAAFVAHLVVDALGGSPLASVGAGSSAFVVVTGLVFTIQEKIKRP